MGSALIFYTALYGLSVLAALIILLRACISDFRTMKIPNILPLILALAFVFAYGASLGMAHSGGEAMFGSLRSHALAFAILFAVTFIMFALRVWGAGDSKLAASVGLWVGIKGIMPFLMVMSLAGVGLVLVGWVIQRTQFSLTPFGAESWPVRLRGGERIIPYGIAIATGAAAAFLTGGYFNIPG